MWEYKSLKIASDNHFFSEIDFDVSLMNIAFNELGQEGWELVSIFDITKEYGGTRFVIATFKRNLQSE